MNKIQKTVVLLTLVALGGLLSYVARATPPNTLFGSVAICSPWNPQSCTIPSASGALPVVVSASGSDGSGASPSSAIVPSNTTAVVVQAGATTLYGAQLYGIGSAPAYVKIYNAATATCGSGTPIKRLMIPAASTAANGAGSSIMFGATGLSLSAGLTYCVTTGIADSDTTAPAASTFLVNLDYK